MKYMFLIFEDPALMATMSDDDWRQMGREHNAFADEAAAAGKMHGGSPLDNSKGTAAVQARDGGVLTVDGPFAETKEQLCGYYLLDCEDLEEAKIWAAKIPSARLGTIEVRPLGEIPTG